MSHRDDPRTMTDRWAAMGYAVKWSDKFRKYVINRLPLRGDGFHDETCATVDEVEAYITREEKP